MTASIKQLLEATGGSLILGKPSTAFNDSSIDTRTIRPGAAFFALRGPRFDGHHYIAQAADRGASAVIVDRLDESFAFSPGRPADVVKVDDTLRALQQWGAFRRSHSGATVIGITGSNGKTTTKEMLYAILRSEGKTLATPGNLNNHIGLPLTCSRLEKDHRFAVIEMGTSQRGDMETLTHIARPGVALITNVGKDHLEFFETPEGVLRENRSLYDRLPADGVAILNLDDPLLSPLKGQLSCRVVTYGLGRDEADVSADEVRPWPLPMTFRLRIGTDYFEASLESPGRLQVLNALAAAATAYALGVSGDRIVDGLKLFKAAAMRMQMHEGTGDSVLINDAYNANPSSVRVSVASFLESFPERRKWLVLGDMRELGPAARDEHRLLGAWLATQPLDRIVLYGRDTRFVLEGIGEPPPTMNVERFRKKREMIKAFSTRLAPEKPAVLFKASRSIHFEDVIAPFIQKSESVASPAH